MLIFSSDKCKYAVVGILIIFSFIYFWREKELVSGAGVEGEGENLTWTPY